MRSAETFVCDITEKHAAAGLHPWPVPSGMPAVNPSTVEEADLQTRSAGSPDSSDAIKSPRINRSKAQSADRRAAGGTTKVPLVADSQNRNQRHGSQQRTLSRPQLGARMKPQALEWNSDTNAAVSELEQTE